MGMYLPMFALHIHFIMVLGDTISAILACHIPLETSESQLSTEHDEQGDTIMVYGSGILERTLNRLGEPVSW